MHTPHRSLLDLRGHFADPAIPESDLPEGRTIYVFGYAFPLDDELAVLVFKTGAMLVNIRTQEIFWSIVCCLTNAALDPAHSILALANAHKLYLWNLANGHLERMWEAESAVMDMAFSPDGSLLAAALWDDPGVILWRTADGQVAQRLQQEDDEYGCSKSIALSPDGLLLAMGNYENNQVWLWNIQNGQLIRRMETHPKAQRINGLAFSPDGALLIGGEFAGDHVPYTHVWDVQTGQLREPFPRKSWLPAFHPEGNILASVSKGTILFWDVASRTVVQECQSVRGWPRHVAFSPGGRTLAVCGEDRAIHWWDRETGREIYRIEPRLSPKPAVAFSADTATIATSTWDGNLRLWNTHNGQLMKSFGLPSLQDEGVAMSGNAQLFVSWPQHHIGAGSLHVWQPASGIRWNLGGPQQWVYQAIISPDGQTVAAICGDKKIRLWSLSEILQDPRGYGFAQPIATLSIWTEARAPLAFSPDGHLLATVGDDQAVHIWDTRNYTCIQTFANQKHAVTSLAFNPNGHLLAAGSVEGGIHVWRVENGRFSQEYQRMQGIPLSVAFDTLGERLGAVSSKGEIRVWSRDNNSPVFEGEQAIAERAYTLDGRPVALESQEEKICLWQLAPTVTQHTIASPNIQMLNLAFRPD
ncbi:MAG TPA: WD40 repeat domain-containing protein, partial [Ktedonobacteraceae bacterium]|nr:WD40 repeat domain-containing protein [Ktedonobacteraceae bacterium]